MGTGNKGNGTVESAPSNGTEPANWSGVDIELLKRFRVKFCQLKTRGDLRPQDPDANPRPGDLVGLLVSRAESWLRQRANANNFPNLTEIGRACQKPVPLNVLNKFFNVKAPRGTPWFHNARSMLKFMLVGAAPNTASNEYKVYETIEDFFFRKLDDDAHDEKPPPFFRRLRSTPEPWTRRELASVVDWALFKHELAGWPTEVVWVSGGWKYFPEGIEKPVARATAEAATGGVTVTFIRGGGPELKTHLGDFYEKYPAAKGDRIQELNLTRDKFPGSAPRAEFANSASGTIDPPEGEVSTRSDFLNPVLQYLYINSTCPDLKKTEDNVAHLYIVRGAREPKKGQAAHLADPEEVIAFERWLRAMREAGTSEKATGASPKKKDKVRAGKGKNKSR